MSRLSVGGVSIELLGDWQDVGDSGRGQVVLARPDGEGALQMSVARCRASGEREIEVDDLEAMLAELADKMRLGKPRDLQSRTRPVRLASASFDLDSRFIRVWYASDGDTTAFVTWDGRSPRADELAECERIVESLEFLAEEPDERR